jgi:polysaccharide pyruvyl transferase CsaB
MPVPAEPSARTAAARLEAVAPARVVLSGWYGAANLGDELLLDVAIRWVRETGAVPVVASVHPAWTRATRGVEAIDWMDAAALIEAIAGADLFAFTGGGLWQDYDGFAADALEVFPARGAAVYAQHFYAATELGVPAVVLGQGVGPLGGAGPRRVTADVFRRAQSASVRDQASAGLLRSIGVDREIVVAPDPAWSFRGQPLLAGDLVQRWPSLQDKRLLAVVLRDWPYRPGWEDQLVAALRGALPPDWACVWLDFTRTPPDDPEVAGREIARRIIARLGGDVVHVVWDGESAAEAAAVIARCDGCLAMRFHGALLAHMAGLPVVTLEYDDKVSLLSHELGVPARQRVALERIESGLRPALESVTGPDRQRAFRLPRQDRERLGVEALAHRDLLRAAIAGAHSRRGRAPRTVPGLPLLSGWLAASGPAAARARDAIARRFAGGDPAAGTERGAALPRPLER